MSRLGGDVEADGKVFDVRLPLGAQLEELDARPLYPVDGHSEWWLQVAAGADESLHPFHLLAASCFSLALLLLAQTHDFLLLLSCDIAQA